MTAKPSFDKRLAVIRVKTTYSGPFRKHPYFQLERKNVRDKRALKKHIETTAGNWPNGEYYLKNSEGQIFVRFDMLNGKVRYLYDKSPITGNPYTWPEFTIKKRK